MGSAQETAALLKQNVGDRRPEEFWRRMAPESTPASTFVAETVLDQLPSHARVLDIGCGTGRLADVIRSHGRDVVGIDINEADVRYAQARRGGKFTVGDASKMPIASSSSDGAMLLGILGAVSNTTRGQILDEAARCLKQHGIMYVSETLRVADKPDWDEVYERDAEITKEDGTVIVYDRENATVKFLAHHFREEELKTLLTTHGFSVEQMTKQPFESQVGHRPYTGIQIFARKK